MGEITLVDGKKQVVKAGSRIVIAPGSTHAFQNVTNRPACMITRLDAATEGPWKELANEGRLGDSGFVQFGRVGGMGAAGPIQMLVFSHHFNYVARMAGMPIWLQDTLSFLGPD